MTLIEIACSVTIALVIVFGIVTVALLESTMHDFKILECRQDRLEGELYTLDKLFHDLLGDSDEQQAEN